MVITAICIIYVLLGTAMEELSMILLTVPIFYPLVIDAGFDPIWFGVIAVVTVETGLISPPVGMNLFVVRGAATDLELKDVMIGVLPIGRLAEGEGKQAAFFWSLKTDDHPAWLEEGLQLSLIHI